jgi:N-acetylneuraminate synthase/N,N'-diacetyllegionaminate synthase
MRLGSRHLGPDHEPLIIAEIGVNHDGSADRAAELVRAAAAAGADAVKFQFFRADLLVSRAAALAAYQVTGGACDARALLRPLELSIDDLGRLADLAHSLSLRAILTVFSVPLVDAAERAAWDAYKTASPDIIHRPLIDALRRTGRPLILSTGGATIEEIERAMVWVEGHPHALMQCVSAYPAPDEAASLGGIGLLARLTDQPVGYSDHTQAVDAGALAVAAGACILEKHLTLDRGAAGPDHAASLEPPDFAEYVRLARRAWRMHAGSAKHVLPIEEDVRRVSRQSITAVRDLPPGHVIAAGDLAFKRPGGGIEPWRHDEIIGRTLVRPVAADTPMTDADVAPAAAVDDGWRHIRIAG